MADRLGTDAPQVVARDGNRIVFTGRVNAFAYSKYLRSVADIQQKGFEEVVLDFGAAEGAFPKGMVPLLSSADYLRRHGIDVEIQLPEDPTLRQLFHNANWAHFLEPQTYARSDYQPSHHVAARRFKTAREQQDLVNAFIDVVMRQMTLQRDVISGLEWSINEITDNVLNHAQAVDGGMAQVTTHRESKKVVFCVADSGRGILASLREGHPLLKSDIDALGEAVKAGVTRNPDAGQGNGLAGTLRIATMSGGSIELTSGRGHLLVHDQVPKKDASHPPSPGTVVYVEIGHNSAFHLADALGLDGTPYQPVDHIEMAYQTEAGDALILRLKSESSGFGSRPLGKQLRNKCLNLLSAEPTKPLLLDWTGVPLVSSSFADELVGKLFVELGPLGFSARVRNQGMEALVRGLVDKAIMQRMAQTMGSTPRS